MGELRLCRRPPPPAQDRGERARARGAWTASGSRPPRGVLPGPRTSRAPARARGSPGARGDRLRDQREALHGADRTGERSVDALLWRADAGHADHCPGGREVHAGSPRRRGGPGNGEPRAGLPPARVSPRPTRRTSRRGSAVHAPDGAQRAPRLLRGARVSRDPGRAACVAPPGRHVLVPDRLAAGRSAPAAVAADRLPCGSRPARAGHHQEPRGSDVSLCRSPRASR